MLLYRLVEHAFISCCRACFHFAIAALFSDAEADAALLQRSSAMSCAIAALFRSACRAVAALFRAPFPVGDDNNCNTIATPCAIAAAPHHVDAERGGEGRGQWEETREGGEGEGGGEGKEYNT